jgi:hypothetical protein
MAEYSYTVLFEPAEEGGYVAFCPALQGSSPKAIPTKKLTDASKRRSRATSKVLSKTACRSRLIRNSR